MDPKTDNPIASQIPDSGMPIKPLHEAVPAADPSIANLTRTGAVFSDIVPQGASSNPIAGTATAQSGVIHDQSQSDAVLDSVLAQVTNNVKAAPPPPVAQKPAKKHGFFGGGQPKKAHPASTSHGPTKSPIANPIHQAAQKPKKPILPISLAILAAIGLGVAAVMAV